MQRIIYILVAILKTDGLKVDGRVRFEKIIET